MTKHVEIENVKGFVLRGYLELPENAKKIVCMFHGFTGNKTEHNGHFRNLARLLAKQGVASIRMDYHGNGESDGEFSDFNFLDAVDDAKRILDYAHKLEGIEEVAILGFSFGGGISGLIANDDNCDKLVLISAAANMPELAVRKFETWRKLENGNFYFNGFELSKDFAEGLIGRNMYENTDKFTKNVLVIQAKDDLAVPYLFGVKYAVNY
ncbi:alpha/beta fold hydrolase [bacterium]|nr:alpha/beta fold hydrolase [bacterium]